MRTLARLLLAMKKLNPDIREFRNCIEPKNFDVLTEAVRKLCKYDSADGSAAIPTVSSSLCSSLKSCANVVISETIKNGALTKQEKADTIAEMNDFLHLMTKDWSTQIGSISEKSRRELRVVREDKLPDPEDLKTFNEYIHRLCPTYVSRLRQLPTEEHYRQLAKLIIVHIISFSRRRPNETVKIKLQDYLSTLDKRTEYGRNAESVLTEEEIRSGNELVIFYIAASKNTKKVPVLLTKAFHDAVEALIASRERLGITSKYLFATDDSEESIFNGSSVMGEFAKKADLKDYKTFTANSLRHHAATSSQLQPHSETYTKRLSKFMGHDLKTHEGYYEMPLPLIQKYKVGHRLLEMIQKKPSARPESTVTSRALELVDDDASRTHDRPDESSTDVQDVSLLSGSDVYDDNAFLASGVARAREEESDDNSAQATNVMDRDRARFVLLEHSYVREEGDRRDFTAILYEHMYAKLSETDRDTAAKRRDDEATPGGSGLKVIYPKTTTATEQRHDTSDEDDDLPVAGSQQPLNDPTTSPTHSNPDALGGVNECPPLLRTPPKTAKKKVRWSDEEKRVVYEKFARNFVEDVNPHRREVKKVWEEEPVLQKRTLGQLVTFVNNIFTRKQKISTPMRRKIKNMVAKNRNTFSP